ncbi:hypothetical protein LCGC14_0124860 [marine sediment metagenome]|uniref:Uncharacterized protein n=1 Tax=marine sediment metagenome TaxID=412755 RepID=A0A0F9XMU4_9ZZZZ|nr:hypothetical protein [Phycisphaerae bacterium]HDZ45350.1 hypothetical protein [Phycisphaerae bacterium]
MDKWTQLTRRRFSTAHADASTTDRHTGRFLYESWKNASQSLRDEHFDIYFGKIFRCKDMSWGNTMGIEASDEATDWLFRIQDDFEIPISLTMNQMSVPFELLSGNKEVWNAFVDWLGGFYGRGLRSCTICSPHMMRSGLLQRAFPDMTWKNTVNQILDNTQKVANYIALGYNFIQLDRSLNRNVDELRNVRKYVDAYNRANNAHVLTCLLVTEGCLPFCPYKREHDDIQACPSAEPYWGSARLGRMTCATWRRHPQYSALPRQGTNCFWNRRETFETYANLVDVFKSSGRLATSRPDDSDLEETTPKNCYCVIPEKIKGGKVTTHEEFLASWTKGCWIIARDSFAEILREDLAPLMTWNFAFRDIKHPINRPPGYDEMEAFRRFTADHFWNTEEYYDLEKVLMNCRNQCWRCHKCEDVYGVPHMDSAVALPMAVPGKRPGPSDPTLIWSSIRDDTSGQ